MSPKLLLFLRVVAGGDSDYQIFVDHYPVTDPHRAPRQKRQFGEPRIERLPALLTRFDWVLGPAWGYEDVKKNTDPYTVYANTASVTGARFLVNEIVKVAETDFDSSHNNRSLVFGDSDKWFTELWPFDKKEPERMEWVNKMRKYFNRITYEALDIQVDGVDVWPITLYEPYLRKNQAQAAEAISKASLDDKPGRVLAAWGKQWPAIEKKGLHKGEPEAISRREARQWASSDAAQSLGVELRDIEVLDWFQEIAKYKFMLAPTGLSLQTPKQVEALLVLTIPIVHRQQFHIWDRLVQLGFPFVIVDNWSDLNAQLLDNAWQALSPRLKQFRQHCLTTDGYWDLVIGKSTPECWPNITPSSAASDSTDGRQEI